MIHTAGGAVLLVTPLLGVLFAWLCPRARLPLLLLALLTLAGVATQAWLGTLLLLDGPAGELLRFMPAGGGRGDEALPCGAPRPSCDARADRVTRHGIAPRTSRCHRSPVRLRSFRGVGRGAAGTGLTSTSDPGAPRW
jgi:hypothetical protein